MPSMLQIIVSLVVFIVLFVLLTVKANKFEVYQDAKKEWRWRLLARNNKIISDSGESYTRREDAIRAVRSVKWKSAFSAIEIKKTD